MPLKPNNSILRTEHLTKRFAGLVAVNDVSMDIARGTITALIGPNGAGKSTLFNLLSGFLRADAGFVTFNGTQIDGLLANRRCQEGLVRTFQVPRIFRRLTVLENLLVADPDQPGEEIFGCFLRRHAMVRRDREARERALELLELLKIRDVQNDFAGTVSGGQRKLIELGRALMTDPLMVMLDEPMAGVNPVLGLNLLHHVELLRQRQGLTFLFVEHDMEVVMRASDRVIVLDEGRVIADGLPSEIRGNERVIEAYLGRASNASAGLQL
jgi:neutral amino acid transport system ATP-binding protein